MTDWISDPDLSADEKLARFEELEPVATRGPAVASALDMPCAKFWDTELTKVAALTAPITKLIPDRRRNTLPIAAPENATAAR